MLNFAVSASSGLGFFRITVNTPNNYREIPMDFFFLHFCKFGFNKGFRWCWFRNFAISASSGLGFSRFIEFTWKFREKLFFLLFGKFGKFFKLITKKGFYGCWFRILWFPLHHYDGFRKFRKKLFIFCS